MGLGYWGPNLVRALRQTPGARVKYGCDFDAGRREKLREPYPDIRLTDDFEELLADDGLDAVAVASPGPTHAALARAALLADKDVFVEKPLARSPEDARELVHLASERGRILMVGHLLEYHSAVVRLGELVASGELGEIFYVYTHRLNLGIVRSDENALWSLAPHDLSIAISLLGGEPIEAQAAGHAYLRGGVEDVVFGTLRFPGGRIAHLHVSWLDPHKERKITVVGSRKMAVFDDTSPDQKLKIYDRGVEGYEDGRGAEYTRLRFGDALAVSLPNDEPLKLECGHFIECVAERRRPVSDGESGLRVVRTLDALQRSLDAGGCPVPLAAPQSSQNSTDAGTFQKREVQN